MEYKKMPTIFEPTEASFDKYGKKKSVSVIVPKKEAVKIVYVIDAEGIEPEELK